MESRFTAMRHPILSSILLALMSSAAHAAEAAGASSTAPGQYTFAWPLGEGALKPRGATTRGAPVALDKPPTKEWERLREPGLSPVDRDRQAILAMAGPYRVSFDFLEVLRFDPALKPDAPYQSWGTEYVFVAEDRKEFIALQHILVMRMQSEDGKISAPAVVRHWRQEWRFEPQTLLVYQGANTWLRRAVSTEERRGAWSQSVLQVDDSPRYAASGRWEHSDSNSTWISGETWRPLPRREFSVRNDYDVLVGTNRHTITPGGWVQEENNLKVVLDGSGRMRARMPYLAREYGVARYERIKDYDFSDGTRYFERTEPFWAEVRGAWRELEGRDGRFTLRAPVDKGQLFLPFFEYAQKLADGALFDREEARAFIQRTLRDGYLAAK
ncbi:MAG: DUF6607 family protein [Burkholderiales bacterium]